MKSTKTKPAKRKLNVELLRKIQQHILEEPKRFVMSCSVLQADTQDQWEGEISFMGAMDASDIRPPCGTAACIAGWADLLTGGNGEGYEARERAARELGVDAGISWSGHTLFSEHDWPAPFYAQYRKADTPAKRAQIAAERIEHLIKTGE